MLGVCIGTISSGSIVMQNGLVTSSFFTGWLAPFPLAVGGLTLALFAFLAAVYLTVRGQRRLAYREDLRCALKRSAIAVGLLASFGLGLDGEIDGGRNANSARVRPPTAKGKGASQPVKKLLVTRPFCITMLPDEMVPNADAKHERGDHAGNSE